MQCYIEKILINYFIEFLAIFSFDLFFILLIIYLFYNLDKFINI